MSIDPLIEQLKQLDQQQLAKSPIHDAETLVQSVVQSAVRRRLQRRRRVAVGAVAWGSAMVVLVLWLRPEREVHDVNAPGQDMAVNIEPVPVEVDQSKRIVDPAETEQQPQLTNLDADQQPQQQPSEQPFDDIDIPTLVSNSLDVDPEGELKRWREEHSRLKRRLEELETLMLREKLSRDMNADDVTKDIFY